MIRFDSPFHSRLVVTGSGFLEGTLGALTDKDEFNHLNFVGDHLII